MTKFTLNLDVIRAAFWGGAAELSNITGVKLAPKDITNCVEA